MDQTVPTNASIYRAIVENAYRTMSDLMSTGRRLNPEGGWIVTYDPTHSSFQQACIAIVFTGIWLEAVAHIALVRRHGLRKAKQFDRESYRDKLRLLDVTDPSLLARAERLRVVRRELVHEKAYATSQDLRFAQLEAESAYRLLVELQPL